MKRITVSIISLFLALVSSWATVQIYPMADGIKASEIYDVQIIQNNNVHKSYVYTEKAQWQTNNCKTTSWTSVAMDSAVKVRVTSKTGDIQFCQVLPRNRGIITSMIDKNTIEFTIDKAGQYSVEFQKGIFIDHPLFIFADEIPNKTPQKGENNLVYFEKGVHHIGTNYQLKSNQTVYLAPGAYVKGQFTAQNAENIQIIGQGILSGEEYAARSENHMIAFKNCKNILVEGITIINAPRYCVSLTGENHICRNLKMMGWWFSTDGIGIGSNGLIENCFFKVNDDAIKLYRSNTIARKCVIWQMENGAPFQIGWNMTGENSNFHVYDMDVIRVEHQWDNPNEAVFDAIHGSSGIMKHYLFEDIRIDNCNYRLFHLMTKPNRFGKWDAEKGELSDFVFRNIECYTLPLKESIIKGHDLKHPVNNIKFENLKINGKLIENKEDANIIFDAKTTNNIGFNIK